MLGPLMAFCNLKKAFGGGRFLWLAWLINNTWADAVLLMWIQSVFARLVLVAASPIEV